MTTWYDGSGLGWCDTFAHFPTMALLWGSVLAAMILAVGLAFRNRNEAPAPMGTVSARPDVSVAARRARPEPDNEEFWRRLM